MPDSTASASPSWVRILQHPLTRLILLGGPVFYMMGVSNGFRVRFASDPLKATLAAIGMCALGLVVYIAFVRFVERRPVSELSAAGMGRELGTGLLIGAACGAFNGFVITRGKLPPFIVTMVMMTMAACGGAPFLHTCSVSSR